MNRNAAPAYPFRVMIAGGKVAALETALTLNDHGFASEISEEPLWQPATKIAAKYLAPYLDGNDWTTMGVR